MFIWACPLLAPLPGLKNSPYESSPLLWWAVGVVVITNWVYLAAILAVGICGIIMIAVFYFTAVSCYIKGETSDYRLSAGAWAGAILCTSLASTRLRSYQSRIFAACPSCATYHIRMSLLLCPPYTAMDKASVVADQQRQKSRGRSFYRVKQSLLDWTYLR